MSVMMTMILLVNGGDEGINDKDDEAMHTKLSSLQLLDPAVIEVNCLKNAGSFADMVVVVVVVVMMMMMMMMVVVVVVVLLLLLLLMMISPRKHKG